MLELGNSFAEGRISAAPMVHHEIHVLLVDHDTGDLINTAKLLEIFQYRVTFIELASAAISMLMIGKAKFDVVIANIDSPDLHGFKLLQLAVSMGLPVVLMSENDNTLMAIRALEDGALLYIKKPAPMEILRYLWQHVFREKARMTAKNINNNVFERGIEFGENLSQRVEQPPENPNFAATNLGGGSNDYKKKKGRSHDGEDCDSENRVQNNVGKKMFTEWTRELHDKFMDAIERLGEGRCFPHEILELMNVPGLTRMQVASHLQKCRNGKYRLPKDRKAQSVTEKINWSHFKQRRYGSKPMETPTNGGNGSAGTNTYRRKKYGSMIPDLNFANSSSNPTKHSFDELFNFPDMDFLIQNLSSVPQHGSRLNNPSPTRRASHFDPAYNDVQNSGQESMESGSNWSSETSNYDK